VGKRYWDLKKAIFYGFWGVPLFEPVPVFDTLLYVGGCFAACASCSADEGQFTPIERSRLNILVVKQWGTANQQPLTCTLQAFTLQTQKKRPLHVWFACFFPFFFHATKLM